MSPRRYDASTKWEILLEALGSANGPAEICLQRSITMLELKHWITVARKGAIHDLAEMEANRKVRPEVSAKRAAGVSLSGSMGGAPATALGSVADSVGSTEARAARFHPPPAIAALNLETNQTLRETETAALQAFASAGVGLEAKQVDALFAKACHELKEPVRGLQAFGQFMREDYGALLDDKGLHYLDTIADSADRMQQLVNGLHAFARTERLQSKVSPVVLREVVEAMRRSLSAHLTHQHATVVVDSRLPTVSTDRDAVAEIVRQLILNGVKFNTRERPTVEVISDLSEAHAKTGEEVLIRDNGIGIPPNNWEKIFLPFERLHRYDEYPGAGMGLAIARRLAISIGGTLRLEASQPGEGSTFRLTLPKKQD